MNFGGRYLLSAFYKIFPRTYFKYYSDKNIVLSEQRKLSIKKRVLRIGPRVIRAKRRSDREAQIENDLLYKVPSILFPLRRNHSGTNLRSIIKV